MSDQVTVIVESKHFKVSKSKLIRMSPYFRAMFTGDFLEKHQTNITLKGITAASWEQILYFMKTGDVKERRSPYLYRDYLSALKVSDMLQFDTLREKCVEWLLKKVVASTALEVVDLSSKLNVECLIQVSRALALYYFNDVMLSEHFQNLPVEQVEGYLCDEALNSPSGEYKIWEAINRWIYANSETSGVREEFLPKLIKCVNLERVTLTELKTISLSDLVRSNEIVHSAIKCVINEKTGRIVEYYRAVPEIEEFVLSWYNMPERRLPIFPGLVAKLVKENDLCRAFVLQYSFDEKKFIPFVQLDDFVMKFIALVGFKVLVNGTKLYLLGGEVLTKKVSWYLGVWEYDLIYRNWSFISNLYREVKHSTACILGDHIYVIGGFGPHNMIEGSVIRLCLKSREWSECSPLPGLFVKVPCCAFRGKIYAIQNNVTHYTPQTDSWCVTDIMVPNGDECTLTFASEDYIFVIGTTNHVYKFDPTAIRVQFEYVGKFYRECTHACLVDNYIYCISQALPEYDIFCDRMNIDTGEITHLWRDRPGPFMDALYPNHHFSATPILIY